MKTSEKNKGKSQNNHQTNGSCISNGGVHTSPSFVNRLERQQIVLWKRPFRTLQYFILELFSISWSLITRFFLKF